MPEIQKQVKPILLRSFGRSGTTLMMQILGTSNNVVFEKTYPFETRYLSYFVRYSNFLSQKKDNSKDWGPNIVFDKKLKKMGPMPYDTPSVFDPQRFSNRLVKSMWSIFSNLVYEKKEELDFDLNKPVYYAEKVPGDIPDIINPKIESKNLFLFRDPRDEFISIKKFNEKRGFNAFGWKESDDDISFAERLCNSRILFMQNLISLKENKKNMKILYEDLILSPEEQTEKLSDWLEVPLNFKKVENLKKHMTSSSPQESVSRWRKEFTPELLDVFKKNIGDELVELGYEL